MGTSKNGHVKKDVLDRLIELRSQGISYNRCAFQLAEEGFKNPRGTNYVSQTLQRLYRPFEGVGAVVTSDPDPESRLELAFQCILVGSQNSGRSGEIFRAQLAAWNQAISDNKGRWGAMEAAAQAAKAMRSARVKK